ncbi:MAG: metalloregulator ArsR/SmtB family transcription factor [Parvularculaceae bacterium]
MSPQPDPQLVFRALADPTRRSILSMLAGRPRALFEIASAFEISRPAVAKHLEILREGGLVETEQQGRKRVTRLTPAPLRSAAEWIAEFERFWDARLETLKEIAEKSYDTDENR